MSQRIDMEMEEVSCPFCGETKYGLHHAEGRFQMVRCSSCQFIFLNPRPTSDALFRFYQQYLPKEEASIESWKKMMEPVFRRATNLILQHRRKGRLLDVGAGFGFFLSEMKKEGWEVMGVEISQRGVNYAREVLGLVIYPGSLEKATFPSNYFDAIAGFYLIEHLPDPIRFLRECHRILKPGGLLLLRYPHTTPIKDLLHLLGMPNRLYDLPAHLSDFSPRIIQSCLERVGFGKCDHLIGGYTLPHDWGKRVASTIFGNISEALFYLSLKKFLFPGVSKTILAFKKDT